jgi:rhodanese-related sulfurtransferase
MNTSNIILAVLVVAAVLFILYQKGYILADFKNISPKEAYKLIKNDKKDVVIIDVRTPSEVKADGKIPNSILVPLGNLGDNVDKLKKYKDKKIIVYCRSGNRSTSASRFLTSLGFKEVYNLQGGIRKWKNEGLPVK